MATPSSLAVLNALSTPRTPTALQPQSSSGGGFHIPGLNILTGGAHLIGNLPGAHYVGQGLKYGMEGLSLPGRLVGRAINPALLEAFQGIESQWAKTGLPGSSTARHDVELRQQAGVHGFRWGEIIQPQRDNQGKRVTLWKDPAITQNLETTGIGRLASTLGQIGLTVAEDPLMWIAPGAIAERAGAFGAASRLRPSEVADVLAAVKTDSSMEASMVVARLKNAAYRDPEVAKAMTSAGLNPERVLTVGLPKAIGGTRAIPGTKRITQLYDDAWGIVSRGGPAAKISELLDARKLTPPKSRLVREAVRSGDVNVYRDAKIGNELRNTFDHVFPTIRDTATHSMVRDMARDLGFTGDPGKAVSKALRDARAEIRRTTSDRGAEVMSRLLQGGPANTQSERVLKAYVDNAQLTANSLLDDAASRVLGKIDPASRKGQAIVARLRKSWETLPQNLQGKGSLAEWAAGSPRIGRFGGGMGGPDAFAIVQKHLDNVVSLNTFYRVVNSGDAIITPSIISGKAMDDIVNMIIDEGQTGIGQQILRGRNVKKGIWEPNAIKRRIDQRVADQFAALKQVGRVKTGDDLFASHDMITNMSAELVNSAGVQTSTLDGLDQIARSITSRPPIPFINPKAPGHVLEAQTAKYFGVATRDLNQVYTASQMALAQGIADMRTAARFATGELGTAKTLAGVARREAMQRLALQNITWGVNMERMAAQAKAEHLIDVFTEGFRNKVLQIGNERIKVTDGPDALRKLFEVTAKWKQDPFLGADADELYMKVYNTLSQQHLVQTAEHGYITRPMMEHIARTLPGRRIDISHQLTHLNWLSEMWRTLAISRPGFSNRNFIGAVMNNWGYGVNRKAYTDAANEYRTFADYHDVLASGGTPGAELAARYATLAAKNNGENVRVLGGISQMLGQGIEHGTIGEPSKLINLGEQSQAFFQNLRGIEVPRTSALVPGGARNVEIRNPINLRGRYIAPLGGGVQKNIPVEVNVRYALFKHLTEGQGFNADTAMNIVNHIHHDYGDLSNLDIAIKKYVPFWTYRSRNLPLQAELLARGVGPGRAILKATATSQQLSQQRGGSLPSYLTGVQIPLGEGRVFDFSSSPVSDFLDTISGVYNMAAGRSGGVESLLSNIGPVGKLPYLYVTRKDPFTGRQIGGPGHPGMDIREQLIRAAVPNLDFLVGTRTGQGKRKRPGQKAGEGFGDFLGRVLGIGEVSGASGGTIRQYSINDKPKYSGS